MTDQHGKGNVEIEWKDPRRNKIKLDMNSKLKLAIKTFAMNQKWTGAFQLVSYTSYQTKFDNDTSKLFPMQRNLYMGVNSMIGVWCNS